MSYRRKISEKKTEVYGSRRFDNSCRNSGSCPWCRGNRLHSTKKREADSNKKELDKFTKMCYNDIEY